MGANGSVPCEMAKITYTPPFTIDSVIRALDIVPFSLPFAAIIPVLTLLFDQRKVLDTFTIPSLSGWKDLLFTKHKWSGYTVIFILVRTLSRLLSRRARNNGLLTPDKPDWNRDIVVVTGGSTGIGSDVVKVLKYNHNAKVAVLDIAEPEYELASAPGVLFIKTDVADPEEVAKAHATIREHFGASPSYVVSCAGIILGGSLLQLKPKYVQRVLDVNTLGNVVMAQEFIPAMIECNHGHFVTIASSGSYISPPMMSSYCMSKAAALTFHEQLQAELRVVEKCPNIRTSVFTPTKVRTLLGHGLSTSKHEFLHPDLDTIQVALSVVDALNSGESQNVSQPYITWLLPFVRALPAWYGALVAFLGDTDSAVTQESIESTIRAGYGRNWSSEYVEKLFGVSDPTCSRATNKSD